MCIKVISTIHKIPSLEVFIFQFPVRNVIEARIRRMLVGVPLFKKEECMGKLKVIHLKYSKHSPV